MIGKVPPGGPEAVRPPAEGKKPKLLDRVCQALRVRHYGWRTE